MNQTQLISRHDDRPLAASDAAAAPPRNGFVVRGRRWVVRVERGAGRVLDGTGVRCVVVGTPARVPAA